MVMNNKYVKMKFSRAISRVKWLSGEQLHHTQSPGKQQIPNMLRITMKRVFKVYEGVSKSFRTVSITKYT
jgi:hypothetical protein